MSGEPTQALVAGWPLVVVQALDDLELTQTARLTMWHLRAWLDVLEYREVKVLALARAMRVKERNANDAVLLLVARGYLDQHPKQKPRALRFPYCRRPTSAPARAA